MYGISSYPLTVQIECYQLSQYLPAILIECYIIFFNISCFKFERLSPTINSYFTSGQLKIQLVHCGTNKGCGLCDLNSCCWFGWTKVIKTISEIQDSGIPQRFDNWGSVQTDERRVNNWINIPGWRSPVIWMIIYIILGKLKNNNK